MIVADSDVLIDFLRGAEPMAGRIAEAVDAGSLSTTVINVFELESGARSETQRAAVATLLAGLEILTFDEVAASAAAGVRRDLEAQGLAIGMADYLIAGVCLAHDYALLSRNRKHFGRVRGLTLLSWGSP